MEVTKYTRLCLIALLPISACGEATSSSDDESTNSDGTEPEVTDSSHDTDTDTDSDTDTDAESETDTDAVTDTDDSTTEADAGSTVDSGPDIDSDTDTGAQAITIAIRNTAALPRYLIWGISMAEHFEGSRVFDCEFSQDHENPTWNPCLIEAPGCGQTCDDFAPDDECYSECEPDLILKEIAPDEIVTVSWPMKLFFENTTYCSAGSESACYDIGDAPEGAYRFSLAVYDTVECGSSDCAFDDEGFYQGESVLGEPSVSFVEFEIPSSSYELEILLTD
jgi:hypothetical protein